jgi:protein-tyrosine phosphatase
MDAPAPEKINRSGTFTDYHCHILPGLDDGPGELSESLEMVSILADFGFKNIFCTPHVIKGTYDNLERIEYAVQDLQAALDGIESPITLNASAEYYLDEYLLDSLDKPLPLHENVVLLEAYRQVQPRFLAETAYRIITVKHLRPLIAHPERYDMFDAILPERRKGRIPGLWPWQWKSIGLFDRRAYSFHDDTETLNSLRSMGCLFQGNIGSFAGIYGERVKMRALRMLEMGLYDHLGTDAHKARKLATWLESGLKIIEQEIGRDGLNKLLSAPGLTVCR